MAQKRFRPEEIILKLREAEAELAQGKKAKEVCKKVGVGRRPPPVPEGFHFCLSPCTLWQSVRRRR